MAQIGSAADNGAKAVGRDEVNLADVWPAVRKQWIWPIAGLFCGLMAAAAYVAHSTPVFESRASIVMGKVHDLGPLEDIDILAARLLNDFGLKSAMPPGVENAYLKQVTRAPGQNNVIVLVAEAQSAEDAGAFLRGIVNATIQRHEQIYEEAMGRFQKRLEIIDRRIGSLTTQSRYAGDLFVRLKDSHPAEALRAMVEEGRLQSQLNQLELDRVLLERAVTEQHSRSSELVASAVTAASLQPLVVLVLGAGVGLLLGIISAVFKESVVDVRRARVSDYGA